jgi:hypothetical protein
VAAGTILVSLERGQIESHHRQTSYLRRSAVVSRPPDGAAA